MGRIALVALGALLAGCETRSTGDKVEVEVKGDAARQEAREAGQEAREGARDAGNAIASGAQQAGNAISSGVQDASANLNETKQELDVRAAFALATDVDKNGITVEGDETAKTITLTGTVPTAEQRTRAEAIATDKAQGWTIINNLTVGPAAAGTGTTGGAGAMGATGATGATGSGTTTP